MSANHTADGITVFVRGASLFPVDGGLWPLARVGALPVFEVHDEQRADGFLNFGAQDAQRADAYAAVETQDELPADGRGALKMQGEQRADVFRAVVSPGAFQALESQDAQMADALLPGQAV